jgi:hypothetical protein
VTDKRRASNGAIEDGDALTDTMIYSIVPDFVDAAAAFDLPFLMG